MRGNRAGFRQSNRHGAAVAELPQNGAERRPFSIAGCHRRAPAAQSFSLGKQRCAAPCVRHRNGAFQATVIFLVT
jgi:hypothetical protein